MEWVELGKVLGRGEVFTTTQRVTYYYSVEHSYVA